MNERTIFPHLSLPQQALVFDLEGLSTCLQTIPDQRDRRGQQYPLASLLISGLLAKPELAQVFKLESQRTVARGETQTELPSGETSLPAHIAPPHS